MINIVTISQTLFHFCQIKRNFIVEVDKADYIYGMKYYKYNKKYITEHVLQTALLTAVKSCLIQI